MDENKQIVSAPYVSYKTFSNFVAGLKITMPGRIDRSVMHTLSGAAQSHLKHALQVMGLMSDQGIPTELFKKLAASEGANRQACLAEALRNGYPFLFSDSIDLSSATGQQLLDQFKDVNLKGDTVRKSVSFFLAAAKDADIKLSPYFKRIQSPTTKRGANNGAAAVSSENGGAQGGGSTPSPNSRNTGKKKPSDPPAGDGWAGLLLQKFPEFNPEWPDEVKSKWFDAFDKLMERRG